MPAQRPRRKKNNESKGGKQRRRRQQAQRSDRRDLVETQGGQGNCGCKAADKVRNGNAAQREGDHGIQIVIGIENGGRLGQKVAAVGQRDDQDDRQRKQCDEINTDIQKAQKTENDNKRRKAGKDRQNQSAPMTKCEQ